MQKLTMTNAQAVAHCLKRHGVKEIFGQSNPSKITLAYMEEGIRQVGYRQENSGSYMAQAYGMAGGTVPVVTAQNGPAATLLVPGLAECLKVSKPIVAIVQQISLHDYEKNAFQEMDHEKLFLGCAKWVKTVLTADRIEDYTVDYAAVARACGLKGLTLNHPDELETVLTEALGSEGTVVVDMHTDDRCVPPVSLLQTAAPQI